MEPPNVDFPDILDALLDHDARATRTGWHGHGMWIAAHRPEPNPPPGQPLTAPYLYLHTTGGDTVPFTPSALDTFADDWDTLATGRERRPRHDPGGGLSYPQALRAVLYRGMAVTCLDWNGPGQHVAAQRPDARSKMTHPYLYLAGPAGRIVPWTTSPGDLFSARWHPHAPAPGPEPYPIPPGGIPPQSQTPGDPLG
jgi:Protein of unknown function (DUF2829)